MERNFTVIALSVGAPGNKIFKSGDIVKESDFIPGRADELVNQKFLRENIQDIPAAIKETRPYRKNK